MYPTEGCLVSLEHHAIHRNPRVHVNPDVFDPDRWLGRNSVLKGAFRPFEHGPRNCIGQDIAYLLLKVALVTTVRRFVLRPAYDELETGANRNQEVDGDEAYQTEDGGPHPALGYPCRVERFRSETS
jgi:hypothetical protein